MRKRDAPTALAGPDQQAGIQPHGGTPGRPAGADPHRQIVGDAITFTVLIGNADAHGKNLALLHPAPGEIRLAPLYDTVPTALWPKLRTRAAMSINDTYSLAAITLADIVAEAGSWPMNPTAVGARAKATAERVHQALGDGRVDVDTAALELVARRTRAFLSR